MPQPGLVGHGVPPRPNDVQRALRDLQRQIDQMHGPFVQAMNLTNAGLIATRSTQADLASTNIAITWTEYTAAHVTVPDGFTSAFATVFASAGATLTGAGNVGVEPLVGYDGTNALAVGPGISNGVSGASAVSVSSYFGVQLNDLTAGDQIKVSCLAYAGAAQSGFGDVHVTSTWLFTR